MVSLAAYDQYTQMYYRGDLTQIFIIHKKTRVSIPLSLLKLCIHVSKARVLLWFLFYVIIWDKFKHSMCPVFEDSVLSIT